MIPGGVIDSLQGGGNGLPERTLHGLVQDLGAAETRERQRIARELHDGIGQLLAMASMKVAELRSAPARTRARLVDDLGELLNQAVKATRNVTFELSCPLLELGLQTAIEGLAERVSRGGGPEVRVEGSLAGLLLPEATLALLFRVVRELVANVQKHAHARHAWIRCQLEPWQLSVVVADDGIGLDAAAAMPRLTRGGGYGLWSVQAQVESLGGQLAISTGPGGGTTVVVRLPLAAA